jgi:transposase-like protein
MREMIRVSSNIRNVTAARRGQIIQHVLVDGWTPEQVAAAYGIAERHVERWVAAYRRRGMASLRDDAAADGWPRRWLRRLRALTARISAALYGKFEVGPARTIVLRRGRDDSGPRPDPDRRPLWN